jgi:hypothetical protein
LAGQRRSSYAIRCIDERVGELLLQRQQLARINEEAMLRRFVDPPAERDAQLGRETKKLCRQVFREHDAVRDAKRKAADRSKRRQSAASAATTTARHYLECVDEVLTLDENRRVFVAVARKHRGATTAEDDELLARVGPAHAPRVHAMVAAASSTALSAWECWGHPPMQELCDEVTGRFGVRHPKEARLLSTKHIEKTIRALIRGPGPRSGVGSKWIEISDVTKAGRFGIGDETARKMWLRIRGNRGGFLVPY